MSLLSLFARTGPSGFGAASTAEAVSAGLDLAGRRILVTGCNAGLGLETCRVLALRGASVVGAARTLEKASAAVGPMGGEGVACELSDPASVRAAVATLREGAPLHAIVCNAGIMALPERQVCHGVELQLFTNHVGHFILVTGLLDRLGDEGRVVMLSSAAHKNAPPEGIRLDDLGAEKQYSAWANYGQAKLANLLFARELARRLEGGRRANAVHPGVIATNLTRSMNPVLQAVWAAASPLVLKSIPEGAATQTWAAVSPGARALNGEYLADCNVAASSKLGADMGLAAKLWDATEAIVARV
jgi:NAD(P)-dependent dehydrogenase (short-subunit alcohol dehydrogenase family)